MNRINFQLLGDVVQSDSGQVYFYAKLGSVYGWFSPMPVETPATEDHGEWEVRYEGFLDKPARVFPTEERARQWARQVGIYGRAIITKREPTE